MNLYIPKRLTPLIFTLRSFLTHLIRHHQEINTWVPSHVFLCLTAYKVSSVLLKCAANDTNLESGMVNFVSP